MKIFGGVDFTPFRRFCTTPKNISHLKGRVGGYGGGKQQFSLQFSTRTRQRTVQLVQSEQGAGGFVLEIRDCLSTHQWNVSIHKSVIPYIFLFLICKEVYLLLTLFSTHAYNTWLISRSPFLIPLSTSSGQENVEKPATSRRLLRMSEQRLLSRLDVQEDGRGRVVRDSGKMPKTAELDAGARSRWVAL